MLLVRPASRISAKAAKPVCALEPDHQAIRNGPRHRYRSATSTARRRLEVNRLSVHSAITARAALAMLARSNEADAIFNIASAGSPSLKDQSTSCAVPPCPIGPGECERCCASERPESQ